MYSQAKGEVSHEKIYLDAFNDVLKSAFSEMRGGYENSIISGSNILKEYVPDSRAVFSESVEALSLSLTPFYDQTMSDAYKAYETKIQFLLDKYGKDNFLLKENNSAFSICRLKLSKILFKEISCLMHRLGYLKQSRYIEGMEELLEEEKEDGESGKE